MVVIGIDPGVKGAVAMILSDVPRGASIRPMPLIPDRERDDIDEDALRELLLRFRVREGALVVYEKLGSLPAMRGDGKAMGGAIGNHRRGLACGMLRGLLAGLGVAPRNRLAVIPQTWQRAMLEGIPGADTKARSIWLAQRLYPAVSLLPTPRSKKPSDGFADALCLAEFGRRMLAGDKGQQRGLLEVGA